jgi:hypothetical protein
MGCEHSWALMSNKKFQPLHLLPVAFVAGILFFLQEKPVPEMRRAPTSIPKVRRQFIPKKITMPRISRSPASVRPFSRLELGQLVVPDKEVKLSRGNILAANLGAIPLSQWKKGMSPILFDDGVYGYYRKKIGEKSIPVAYSPAFKNLYPVSSILHIRGVDENLRQELKKSGYQEYIYFKNIRKLSLKTSPDQVVKLYQDLGKQGLDVKLEVLQLRPEAH